MGESGANMSEDETMSVRSVVANARNSAFVAKVHAANEAFRKGNLVEAGRLYSEALAFDPTNYVIYGNRSIVRLKLGLNEQAASDAHKARLIKPSWIKVSAQDAVERSMLTSNLFCIMR